ncbi:MAG: hypothetical protein R3175_09080 [Marinobacter sp.]|uniref:hypothetical protein n=1 Tax=Marinobacter sp. TaxID=50741 RepID=UPI00299F0EA9|nr:hypothetical protein [Marinobacter sp.]MDX1756197.1 hypothetical protein [Marinobacter sp.]
METKHFHYSASTIRTVHLTALLGLLLGPVLGSALILAWLSGDGQGLDALIRSADGSLDAEILLLMVAVVLMALIGLANRQVRLELNDFEFKVHIPRFTGLGLMGLTTGSHRIPLASIRELRLQPEKAQKNLAQSLQRSRLEVVTDNRRYRFQPYNFLLDGGPDHRIGLGAALSKQGDRLEALLNEAPLVNSLSQSTGQATQTGEPDIAPGPLANQYNLLKHRGMVVQLFLLTVAGLYGAADLMLLVEYKVLGELPLWPFVSTGLLTAALCSRLGRGAPMAERLGVAVLVTLAATAATYPGLQRFTLVTSQPVTTTYQVAQAGVFRHPSYPQLDLRGNSIPEFWATLPVGSDHRFTIYPSTFGFRLVDLTPLYAQSRAFYGNQAIPDGHAD